MGKLLIISFLLLTFFTAFSKDFYESGYYTDWNGNTTRGYISLYSTTMFKFKSDTCEKKYSKLHPEEVKQFVVGDKKYDVLYNVKAKSDFVVAATTYPKAFAEIVNNGKLGLYKIRIRTNNGQIYSSVDHYFYFVNYNLVQANNGGAKFRKQLKSFIKDDPELCNKVDEKKPTYTEIETWVEAFNRRNK